MMGMRRGPFRHDDPRPCGPGRAGTGGGRRHLEPVVLLLLAEGHTHGYGLAEALAELRPSLGPPPDPSQVYRLLQLLEEEGAVRSRLEPGARGLRKTYELTAEGFERLALWIPRLKAEHERLGALIERLSRLSRPPEPSGPEET
jgi:DNA-binding PadR family transcriptional regulator